MNGRLTSLRAGSIFGGRSHFKNRSTTFTLGTRDSVLTTELEDPIIVIPHAQKGERKVSDFFARPWRVLAALYLNGLRFFRSILSRHFSAAATLVLWTMRPGNTCLSRSFSASHHRLHRNSSTPFLARHCSICW